MLGFSMNRINNPGLKTYLSIVLVHEEIRGTVRVGNAFTFTKLPLQQELHIRCHHRIISPEESLRVRHRLIC